MNRPITRARPVAPACGLTCDVADSPRDAAWEAFAQWRPSCFGRLALEYATRFQVSVLPLLVDGSAPVSEVPGGSKDASRNPATIQAWWTRAPRANVGIACAASGLLVLKVDPREGGLETLAMHARRLGPLPSTWTARAFDGGTQLFFSHDDPDVQALQKLRPLGPGVHLTHKSYVLAPPSVFQGRRVAWHPEGRPGKVPLAAMPNAWLARLAGRRLPTNGLSGLDARHLLMGRAFETLGWIGRWLDDAGRIARGPRADVAPRLEPLASDDDPAVLADDIAVPKALEWAARELMFDLGIDLPWREA